MHIAGLVNHISEELEPNKCIVHGQIGTYVLLYTNYVKKHHIFQWEQFYQIYQTRFFTILVMWKWWNTLLICTLIVYTYVYYWWWDLKKARYEETVHYLTTGWSWTYASWVNQVKVIRKWQRKLF